MQKTQAYLLLSVLLLGNASANNPQNVLIPASKPYSILNDKRWLISLGAKCAIETAGDAFDLGYVKQHEDGFKPIGGGCAFPVADMAKTIATYGCEEALDKFCHATIATKDSRISLAKEAIATWLPVVTSHLVVESTVGYHAAKENSRLAGKSASFLCAKLLMETIKSGLLSKTYETFSATPNKPLKTILGFGEQLAPIFDVNKQQFDAGKFVGKTLGIWVGSSIGDSICTTDTCKAFFAKKHREKAFKKLIGMSAAPWITTILKFNHNH